MPGNIKEPGIAAGFAYRTGYALRVFPVDHSLDELETLLDPTLFFRLNRRVIANINAVRGVSGYGKARLTVELEPEPGLPVQVSREKTAALKKWLDGNHV